MTKRIIFGGLMIVAAAGLLWADWWLESRHRIAAPGVVLAAILVLLTVPAFRELARLSDAAGGPVLPVSGLVGCLGLAMLPVWGPMAVGRAAMYPLLLLTLSLIVAAVFAEQMIRRRTDDVLRRLGSTFLAVMYLGVGGAMILSIRTGWGVPTLVLFLAAVKATDVGAYFTGSACGRHKLIPWLSPGKSWEGLAGGLACGAVVGAIAASVLPLDLAPWQAAIFGVIVGLAGQFADLCESLLKRSAKAKDSGKAVPEFGGVLDIVDSPLLAAPVAQILLILMT